MSAAVPAMLRIACRSYVRARLEILTVEIIWIAVAVLWVDADVSEKYAACVLSVKEKYFSLDLFYTQVRH